MDDLTKLEKEIEEKDKLLLKLEWVIASAATICFAVLVVIASYFEELPNLEKVLMITVGSIILAIGIGYAIKIEQVAGYYECRKCHHKYVPKYQSVFWAPHSGRTRYMRCPECNEKSWQKKVIRR